MTNTQPRDGAQPLSSFIQSIVIRAIRNASPQSEQTARIDIAVATGLLTDVEAQTLRMEIGA